MGVSFESVQPDVGSMLTIHHFELLGQPNIYENDVALLVKHDVVELDICVNVSKWVEIFDALYQFNPNNDGVFVTNMWTSPDLLKTFPEREKLRISF